MNRKFLSIVLLITVFAACKKDSVGPTGIKDDAAFVVYESTFLDGLWKVNPDWATSVGYHKYDSLLLVPSNKTRDKQLEYYKSNLDSLSHYEIEKLSQNNRIDYQIMQNQLQYLQWDTEFLKEYEWNPTHYNVIGTFAYILNEHYAPLAKRLRNFYQKMANIPDYYKEAEKQIKNPVVELTNLAIDQHLNGVGTFEKDFADSLKKSNIPEAEQKQMLDRAAVSATAIRGFAAFLKGMKNDHPRDFRLGQEYYNDKFKYEIQSQYTSQQIFNAATERKKFVHHEMAQLSRQLWPKYFGTQAMPKDSMELISKVIDTIASRHVDADNFQSSIEQLIPKLTAFVRAKDLVTMDPSKPLVVRKEPGYMAGSGAGASMSSPGPYDKTGNSYFNVGSLAGYSPEQAESYLREYNNYTLQILCIHEAIPGHYVQLVYANQSPSLIKSIFGNNAMIEGWAVYGEQMMLDNGYGGDNPEMKLMWYKWHLRSVCNTILDYSVHAAGMTKDQAITFLTHEAFQQKTEAENKWKRVTVSSVQLDCYYTGYKEIMDLRELWKKDQGVNYTLKGFNEKFLSYGSAPVKYIKEAMMKKDTHDSGTGTGN
ncbi:Uncharacterized conserved protein, DUF885 familyt [Mucilaginibacter mallensis]|uniref:Uncharacterized conserved protein, DUF885 familyt n=1 Tax=Mucilaginibacter mallensis TaxID=652787 RepID=A0A1H1PBZ7_MUCMA|nr:DUF885 domain-containing protein [Mucilaginibacter mallensis]SDS08683.1 Uncharacterized conserved protein, DUF885 familyt [Mucilaginibacter mallensis]